MGRFKKTSLGRFNTAKTSLGRFKTAKTSLGRFKIRIDPTITSETPGQFKPRRGGNSRVSIKKLSNKVFPPLWTQGLVQNRYVLTRTTTQIQFLENRKFGEIFRRLFLLKFTGVYKWYSTVLFVFRTFVNKGSGRNPLDICGDRQILMFLKSEKRLNLTDANVRNPTFYSILLQSGSSKHKLFLI